MKLSIAIAGAFVAGAAATAIPDPAPRADAEAGVPDFLPFDGKARLGHGFVPAGNKRDVEHEKRAMPCPKARMGMGMGRMGRMGERKDADSGSSWVPGPLSALLSRLGLDVGAHHLQPMKDWSAMPLPEHHKGHHGDNHHHGYPGHAGHHSEEDNVDFSIFMPIARPADEPDFTFISIEKPDTEGDDLLSILPIFGDEDVNAKQEAHRLKLQKLKAEEGDHDDHHHHHHHHHGDKDHKHHKDHKHKHHKGHKHHKDHKHKHHHHGHKGVVGKMGKMGHKACDMFASLPPHVRAGVSALMSGTMFLIVFGLVFAVLRRRRMSREERRARRRQRKEARRAAKAAYKAAKAARRSKEAEAGFALAHDESEAESQGEALPSYKDNETDALVVRQ